MDIYVLNSSYQPIAVIDSFKSLIWTKRYFTCGDFELYLPADRNLLQYLQPDNFLMRDDDDSVMVIERMEIQTDAENGDFYIVSGRSLESILTRRIVRWQTNIDEDDVVQGLKALIVEHTGGGDPDDNRSFQNFVIDDSLEVPAQFKAQFTYNVLLDAVTDVCMQFGIGFRMTISAGNMVLSFYAGSEVDVIFSPEFDNLINSDYAIDYTDFYNFALIAGEGEGRSRTTITMGASAAGLALRELYVDARDLSSNGGDISAQTYSLYMLERGAEKLAEHDVAKSFEAEIEPAGSFRYKIDYNLGDVVTVTNEYGVTANPRIVEIIESWDDAGYTVIPTFDGTEINT